MLKKSYPNGIIPEYTIHTDYNSMKKSYDDTVRRLSLDSTVDNYKQYLIGGFMACEFLLGNFFNLEIRNIFVLKWMRWFFSFEIYTTRTQQKHNEIYDIIN